MANLIGPEHKFILFHDEQQVIMKDPIAVAVVLTGEPVKDWRVFKEVTIHSNDIDDIIDELSKTC